MEVIHMVPFTVRERDQQIWLKGVDAPPLDRGEILIYYLNMESKVVNTFPQKTLEFFSSLYL